MDTSYLMSDAIDMYSLTAFWSILPHLRPYLSHSREPMKLEVPSADLRVLLVHGVLTGIEVTAGCYVGGRICCEVGRCGVEIWQAKFFEVL
jgi:hypothetical protein